MPATILVVEDEPAIAELVATVLEMEGHNTLRAHDGIAALEQIKRGGFDLLITDNMLPHLNGVVLIGYMHDHPEVATPVILMSAVRPVPTPPHTTFLPKPFEVDDLLALVHDMLGE